MATFRFVGAAAFGFAATAISTVPSIVAAQSKGLGPNFRGDVGRKAAATTFNYLTAMKQSKVTWTQANLDRYLKAPTKIVPGTKMGVAVGDSAQRAAMIKYLSQTK